MNLVLDRTLTVSNTIYLGTSAKELNLAEISQKVLQGRLTGILLTFH